MKNRIRLHALAAVAAVGLASPLLAQAQNKVNLGVAIAQVVAVTDEIAANPNGMGYAIMIAQQSLDPALMLAWLFWIGVVGFAVNDLAQRVQAWVARRMGVFQ